MTDTIPAPAPTETSNLPPLAIGDDPAGILWNLCHELSAAVGARKAAEAERDAACKPLKAAYDKASKWWKAKLQPSEDLEESLRAEVLATHRAFRDLQDRILASGNAALIAKMPQIPSDLSGISIMSRTVPQVKHVHMVPLKYLAPDMAKIKAAIADGIEVPGVDLVEVESVVVR
jgi:hypothetical protein